MGGGRAVAGWWQGGVVWWGVLFSLDKKKSLTTSAVVPLWGAASAARQNENKNNRSLSILNLPRLVPWWVIAGLLHLKHKDHDTKNTDPSAKIISPRRKSLHSRGRCDTVAAVTQGGKTDDLRRRKAHPDVRTSGAAGNV